MTLDTVTDAFLARRAGAGDEAAFAELVRRYRPLIGRLSSGPPPGVDIDDLRQEGLLGLLDTCRLHDPSKGPFAALARKNVTWRVRGARRHACAAKPRVLSEAAHDGEDPLRWIAIRVPAPAGSDPALVVELREELRERAELAQQPARARRPDGRRRYSDDDVTRALTLIADGKTIKEAAFAVGAPSDRILRWIKRAGQPRPGGRRCFTAEEIRTAVALVNGGASLRQAAAAVGASSPAVLRWVRKAA
jgi:transposase-like protein